MEKRKQLALMKPDELIPELERMWPELKRNQTIAFTMAQIAIMHGLDPFLQEISLYKGSLLIAHKAKMRKALESGKLESLDTRPATEEEWATRGWTKQDTMFGFVAEMKRKGMGKPFKGYGRVTVKEYDFAKKKEAEKEQEKGEERPLFLWLLREPADLAEKRAIDDAWRLGFTDSIIFTLPTLETTVIEGEYKVVEEKPEGKTEEGAKQDAGAAALAASASPAGSAMAVTPKAEEEQSPQLPTDNRLILWNNITGLLGKLKPKPRDDIIQKWFLDHYSVKVSPETFGQDQPPEELTEKILKHFHDSLLTYEANLKRK